MLVTGAMLLPAAANAVPTHDKFEKIPAGGVVASRDARMVRDPEHLAMPGEPLAAKTGELRDAQIEDVALMASRASYRLPESPVAPSVDAAPKQERTRFAIHLPEPDGWTAVAATLALAVFFFLRRLA